MITGLISKLERVDAVILKIETGFCCSLVVAMVFNVGLSVFLRYIFKNPLIAGMNIATLMLVWLTFFGASAVYKEQGHIALEFLLKCFIPRVQVIIRILIFLSIAIALIWTIIQTILLMQIQWTQQIVALGIPRSFLSLPVAIAVSLMLFSTFRYLITEINKQSDSSEKVL